MGCLEFEVIPEVSLRNEHVEFMLGMPLCQTITALQNAARHIRNIELTYSDKDPLSRDITITLANDGIRLVFDARCQQLKLIEVYDLSHIALRYCSSFISKPTDQATVAKIESSFGATHPGVYDKKLKVYTLSWRGLSFCFSTPNDVAPSQQSPFAHGLGSLQFPNGSSPVVAKMYIFNGATLADARVVDVPIECYGGNNRLQSVGTVKSNGTISAVVFNFSAETTRTQSCLTNSIGTYTRTVSFGDTEDSVLSALGSPSRVFLKSEDKMRIHRPSGDRIRELDGTDFFFNYFSMGVDILFDSRTRRVQKFVLHTNYPGHFDFGIYSRCNFEIELESSTRFDDGDTQHAENALLTAFSKFENFSNIICECDSDKRTSAAQPVVLNRTSSSGVQNPFGSTFCYGCGQLIIEVMSNGHIASVTIFKEEASI